MGENRAVSVDILLVWHIYILSKVLWRNKMGNRMVKFNFQPGENEQIDAVIKVPQETRSVFHGFVIDENNKPIKNAVVKLLIEDSTNKRFQPVTHTFTDSNGEFALGPLCAHMKYVIKIWDNNVKTKQIVIKPDECEEECIKGQSREEKVIRENS
jgi:uncharacterized GH25 family protein